MEDARKSVLIYSTKSAAALTDNLGPTVDLRGIAPPFLLVVRTRNVGTAPTGTFSCTVQVQQGDLNGEVFADVSGFVNTAIAAAGDQFAVKEQTGQLSWKARAKVNYSVATAYNSGTDIQAWIVGNGG